MEISIRWFLIKLDVILPFAFAFCYLIGDTAKSIQKIEIKDFVSILTGVCIATFYIYKLSKEIRNNGEIKEIKKRLDSLENKIQ